MQAETKDKIRQVTPMIQDARDLVVAIVKELETEGPPVTDKEKLEAKTHERYLSGFRTVLQNLQDADANCKKACGFDPTVPVSVSTAEHAKTEPVPARVPTPQTHPVNPTPETARRDQTFGSRR